MYGDAHYWPHIQSLGGFSCLITEINRSDYILCILGSKLFFLSWAGIKKHQKYPTFSLKYPMYFDRKKFASTERQQKIICENWLQYVHYLTQNGANIE
jgi:hypothetical protein